MNFDWDEWYTAVDPMVAAMADVGNVSALTVREVLESLPPVMHGNMNIGMLQHIDGGLFGRVLQVLPVTFMRPYVFRMAEDGKSATILVLRDDMHLLFTIDESSYLNYKLSYTECSPSHGVEIEGGVNVTVKRGRERTLKKLLSILDN
jgi:hypothetical protein